VLGFCEFDEEPVDFRRFQWLINLDGGVTGDAGGDAAATGLGVLGLLRTSSIICSSS
jgi:hypothetical protein